MKLAKSIIHSEYGEGVNDFTRIKSGDSPETVFMKLWLNKWFMGENIAPEEMTDLAVRTLEWLIRKDVNGKKS